MQKPKRIIIASALAVLMISITIIVAVTVSRSSKKAKKDTPPTEAKITTEEKKKIPTEEPEDVKKEDSEDVKKEETIKDVVKEDLPEAKVTPEPIVVAVEPQTVTPQEQEETTEEDIGEKDDEPKPLVKSEEEDPEPTTLTPEEVEEFLLGPKEPDPKKKQEPKEEVPEPKEEVPEPKEEVPEPKVEVPEPTIPKMKKVPVYTPEPPESADLMCHPDIKAKLNITEENYPGLCIYWNRIGEEIAVVAVAEEVYEVEPIVELQHLLFTIHFEDAKLPNSDISVSDFSKEDSKKLWDKHEDFYRFVFPCVATDSTNFKTSIANNTAQLFIEHDREQVVENLNFLVPSFISYLESKIDELKLVEGFKESSFKILSIRMVITQALRCCKLFGNRIMHDALLSYVLVKLLENSPTVEYYHHWVTEIDQINTVCPVEWENDK